MEAEPSPSLRGQQAFLFALILLVVALPGYVIFRYFAASPPIWAWILLAAWAMRFVLFLHRFREGRDTWTDFTFFWLSVFGSIGVAAWIFFVSGGGAA